MKYRVAPIFIACAILFAGCSSGGSKEAFAPTQEQKADDASKDTASTAATQANAKSNWDQILKDYRQYAIDQSDHFVKETEKFVRAVKSGDIDTAKKLYAPTRMYYERIEPIAEVLGARDPNIDAREGDVPDADWRGFHRIEKALWMDNTTEGQNDYADKLLTDVQSLRALIETVDVTENTLITGAVGLLNEVSSTKITGEEERYSHTDLYDIVANVEGAKKIYELLQGELKTKDLSLEKQIGDRFTDLETALEKYKDGDGYVSYDQMKEEDTKKLSQLVDALAEPLSQMGTILGS